MGKTIAVLGALLAGVALGFSARWPAGAFLNPWIDAVAPIGAFWIRALSMTLVPLVFALVVSGVINAVRHGQGGRVLAVSFAVFLPMLVLAVLLAWAVVETVLRLFPLGPNPLAGLLGSAPAIPQLPGTADQILAILPENPIAAAASGQMLPLVVFAVLLGAALARTQGDGFAGIVDELARAMTRIVDWILLPAPIGIFVLSLGAGKAAGASVAGVLAREVGAEILFSLCAILLCYGLVLLVRAMPLGRFARAIVPAQATAAGTCSSMATAPVSMDVALNALKLPQEVAGTTMPLAISTFRLATAGVSLIEIFVAAHAAGVHASPVQWLLAGMTAVIAGIATPGLPGAAIIYACTAPGLQILGAPLAIIPLYIATAAIPDMFITTASVTGQLTATTLVARLVRRSR
ncbi:cation:dicarboxylase symporter family transporter [uncultured Sphingomonas sp.]|uniref:dicarboxylate/amino acid:cation symporter n=1 Tax=uncultured Sphingomonas sp. TaxID=158754 RepID=UPI0025F63847|nr:cation:dicarboxylase symporter family transporter [uncultured Sphingomonas sp.]